MQICVEAPGSCGELVQGRITGQDFLVTCPVNWYSRAFVTDQNQPATILERKVARAIQLTLQHLGEQQFTYVLDIVSTLPKGKGMASSSADISVACQAVALTFGKKMTPDEIANIALSIEPTDGIFYNGIMLFDHLTGKVRDHIGMPPPISLLAFDVGGNIDTIQFNSRKDLIRLNAEKENDVKEALRLIRKGITKKRADLVGKGATISALANQKILYKPQLEELLRCSEDYGGVGINIAHSGTVVGILFDKKHAEGMESCLAQIHWQFPKIRYLNKLDIISGGLKVMKL